MSLVLKPFEPTEAAFEAVRSAAETDNHGVFYPTQVVEKDGQIVGYFSAAAFPLVQTWLHSKKVRPIESLRTIQQMSRLVQFAGFQGAVVPCDPGSPFHKLMPRLGFKLIGNTDLFFRKF